MSVESNNKMRKQGVNAFAWDVSGKLLKQGVTFFVTIILARVLGPEEFGFVAMAMFFVSVSTMLIDLGLSASLVQAKNISQQEYSTVFVINVAIGFLLSLSLYFASESIARFYGEPRIIAVMKLLAINPLIGSINVVHIAILTREMRFRVQTYASFVSSIVSGVVAILLAYSGYGVWSLVLQTIIGLAIQTIIIWSMERWRPRMHYDFNSLRSHMTFSGRIFLSGVINTVYERIDLLLIGKLFSAADLGLYYRATSFNTLIIRYAGNSLVRVYFPLISRIQDDILEVKRIVERSLHGLSISLFLLSGIIYASANEIIALLFSERWLPAAPYLRLVMMYAYAYPVSAVLVNVLTGTGNSKAFLRLEIYKKIVLTICIPIGLYFGIYGYLVAMGIAYIGIVALNALMVGHILRMRVDSMLVSIFQYAIIAILSVSVAIYISSDMPFQSDTVAMLQYSIMKTLIVVLVYLVINRLLKTVGYAMFKNQIRLLKIRRI